MSNRLKTYHDNITSGVSYAFGTPRRVLHTVIISVIVFAFVVLAAYPAYTTSMIFSGVGESIEAFQVLFNLLLIEQGVTGLVVLVVYALLTGIVVRILIGRASMIQADSTLGAIATFFGVATAGCASCGVGFLGMVGGMGGIALIPFDVTGLRLFAIVLLVVYVAYEGDPRECEIR